MSRLFADAVRVFETAVHDGDANFGILLDPQGAIRIVSSDGWRPEALLEHYGARSVFQVTRGPSGIRVDARSGADACSLTRRNPLPPFALTTR